MSIQQPADQPAYTRSPWTLANILLIGFLFVMILLFISISLAHQGSGLAAGDPQGIPGKPALSDPSVQEKLQELEAREQDLLQQSQALLEQENRLKEQEESLRSLVDVRTNIVRELTDKFSQSNLVLDIDSQTGAIRFSDGIFFDSNRDLIKSNGEEYLKEFIPSYISILLSEANRDYIAEIIIEGHTDDVGSYIYNLDLSQRRAFAVARYILERDIPNFPYQTIIHEYLTANGRSFSQPILNQGRIDQERSRRVEFKFRLKDEDTIQEIQQIFEGARE